ncbi:MAG: sulfatase [Niabella sp.]
MTCILPSQAQHKQPNIIFILSDDHAYQATGAYGNKQVQTPNIDRLAREGAKFNNTFVANSICGPSRATFLTGKYSHKNGYTENEQEHFDVSQFTFPRLLQQHGYQTAWIGKLHLGSLPVGFDYFNILPGQGQYVNPDFINNNGDTTRYTGYVTNLITDFLFDWLKERDQDKPFFAVVGEKATHREWLPDIQDLGAYDNVNFDLPRTFYDDYATRLAAQQQDMSIAKTLTLRYDLKVNRRFILKPFEEMKPSLIEELKQIYPDGRHFTEDYLKRYYGTDVFLASRMNAEQQQAYQDYYDKITKEFKEKKLTGNALTEWKFQRYLKDYNATAKSMDRNIGRILQYLDSTGLNRNTIVIYASDQGFYMGEHGWFDKRFMYDESLRTAFLMRYPGVVSPDTQVDQMVSNIDWAPTILDIAGVKSPAEVQGKSVLPLVKRKAVKGWRDAFYYHYYEYPEPHRVSPHFGLRTKDYLLIRFYKGTDSWELFDLKNDPHQLKNVYGQSKYGAVQKKLKNTLRQQILKYEDKEALGIFDKEI